jgi:heme/copper-type cytochrome/quinol oxidase subunit 2
MHTSSALDPQSPLARAIYEVGIVSTIIFFVIFVAVTGAIVYAIFHFRAREGDPDPPQNAGNERDPYSGRQSFIGAVGFAGCAS